MDEEVFTCNRTQYTVEAARQQSKACRRTNEARGRVEYVAEGADNEGRRKNSSYMYDLRRIIGVLQRSSV